MLRKTATEEIQNLQIFLLGAGKPFQGDQHSALRNALGSSRVLDWFLRSVNFLNAKINFVAGYQVDAIKPYYPDLNYIINENWDSTGSASSLIRGIEASDDSECLAFYSDILFRESLVKQLFKVDADIVVAVDSCWQSRFKERQSDDLNRCEKASLNKETVTRLGTDIPISMASAEFVGCVRFSSDAVQMLGQCNSLQKQHLEQHNLSELIEMLRVTGMTVKAVDVCGDWAELNDPQDLARFILGTKAQTLRRLQPMVTKSKIEEQVSFTIDQWHTSSNEILSNIQWEFKNKRLVIRSSALSEDGFTHSNAGAYTSLLDVENEDPNILAASIEEVIHSYPDNNPDNQVLVQPMLDQVLASGVVFTRSLAHDAPYYVLNYDDTTGSTESITNGSSREHKTLLIRRDTKEDNPNIPDNVRSLLPALKEIESLLNFNSLDIEFAITAGGGVHILQVRPIATKHHVSQADGEFFKMIDNAGQRFLKLQNISPFSSGKRTMFGIMPDWNPAEIIGTKPRPLATSLYKNLIMDDIWATQRADYGYKDVRPQELMVTFAGQPYVNVGASFSSFIPDSIDKKLATKLVNFYLDWLEKHPHLHDKVEFDVVPTCFSFDFERWERRLLDQGSFSQQEVDQLREALIKISAGALKRNKEELDAIGLLEKRFTSLKEAELDPLDLVYLLLKDCKELGTLPFAHLARSAFVAMTLLKSAVSTGIITQSELDGFLSTIRTVSHTFTEDARATSSGGMKQSDFIEKYGHLRPGTYDITSYSYADDPEHYITPVIKSAVKAEQAEHSISEEQCNSMIQRLCFALNEKGIECTDTQLNHFMRDAIEGREYAKYAFTRNLSLALDMIVKWGETIDLDRDALSFLTIDRVYFCRNHMPSKELYDQISKKIARAKQRYEQLSCVELPPLLSKSEDFSAFLYPSAQANFVGSGAVIAVCAEIGCENKQLDLTGKIVLIPQADPGYDWLFGRDIAGLITMYGGANSHMAIRSAEFGLPAAIGVGENTYQRLARAKELDLNPVNRIIRVIRE